LLAAGDGAVLSHGTAAWRWQIIPAPPTRIELTVPRRRTTPPGLTLHRGRLRPGDLFLDARFPSTSVPRTLLDLAARYDQRALLKALAGAEFHHDTRPADIQATLRRGHPGSANLRAALKHHAPGHGKVNMWPTRCVAVELDGRQHTRPHQADSDDDRDLWLRRQGYVTRRYGKRQVDERPDDVIADLLDAFAQADTLGYTS
jgi:hypothetical protein